MRRLFFVLFVISVLAACQNNKLKTNEKELVEKILSEEEVIAQKESVRIENEKLLADSIAKLPKGFRFKEKRSVDLENPPMVIDIANSLDSIKDFKLSDVASRIEYIRMDPIPDSTIPNELKFRYHIMDNFIVASNLYGIHLYSKAGKYIQAIVKNKLTGLTVNLKKNRISVLCSEYTHIGGKSSVWSRGNSLFYNYQNSITGQNYIMELDCTKHHVALNTQFDPENPNAVAGLGKVSMDLNNGINKPEKPLYPNGMFSYTIYHIDHRFNVFNPDINTYITHLRDDKMLGILSSKGDTLASFRKHEQVKNYTKRNMRGTDYGTQYVKGDNYFLRTDFNDTIFQIIPPNYLKPKYVLNLGKYKVDKQAGVDPGYDLKGKIIPMGWADANDYIFLTFSKDSYDCPRNRKNKSLKVYHSIFSKKNQKFQIVKGEPTDYSPDLLVNDLDGGISVWPQVYMINKKGEIMISLKGKELKGRIQSKEFSNSLAPLQKKEALKQIANSCSNQDNILMLVK